MNKYDSLINNLKELQDLKFLIFILSHKEMNFHNFGITDIKLSNLTIDLILEYQSLNQNKSLDEIATLIIQKYNL